MAKRPTSTFQKHQVFVASPGDVSKERRLLEEVISELNRTVAGSKQVFLQTRRWELDAFPGYGKDAQALVNAQLADMSRCRLFIGILWNRMGTKTLRAISGTAEEFDRAVRSLRKNGQPEIWLYFRETLLKNPTDSQLLQLQQVNQFRSNAQGNGLNFTYKTPNEFRDLARRQLTLWLEQISGTTNAPPETLTRINCFKLYYFRQTQKLSFTELSRETGIDRLSLRKLENPGTRNFELTAESFPEIETSALRALERVLECHGKLAAGQPDDFLTQYMLFYDTYKSLKATHEASPARDKPLKLRFRTRAVVFDFGGTLTQPRGKYTTWESLWIKLGYSVNACSELHRRFQTGELSHQQWCDQTCAAFREKGLTERQLQQEAKRVQLVPGVESTVISLRKRGVKLYIASGSLKPIIRHALGPLSQEFEEIRANDVSYDGDGVIEKLHSTPYDFKGKADFLRRIVRELGTSPLDVLFVGNSCNDVFASEAGVRTLCVNPRFTDPENPQHWTYAIREMTNLGEILPYTGV